MVVSSDFSRQKFRIVMDWDGINCIRQISVQRKNIPFWTSLVFVWPTRKGFLKKDILSQTH